VPKATIIAAAIEGLIVGQYATKLSRKPPATVKELFEIMGQYARSDDDFKRQKAARRQLGQTPKAPRPPQSPTQRNVRPYRAINNLQEESGQSVPQQPQPSQP